jgi:hypothetical protein
LDELAISTNGTAPQSASEKSEEVITAAATTPDTPTRLLVRLLVRLMEGWFCNESRRPTLNIANFSGHNSTRAQEDDIALLVLDFG